MQNVYQQVFFTLVFEVRSVSLNGFSTTLFLLIVEARERDFIQNFLKSQTKLIKSPEKGDRERRRKQKLFSGKLGLTAAPEETDSNRNVFVATYVPRN